MKNLILLGSTGSIGTQTLELVRRDRARYRVVGLSARSNWEPLLEQVREFSPRVVAVEDEAAADRLAEHLPSEVALLRGSDAALAMASEADYDQCLHGIVGAIGVRPSEAVLARGKSLALANKESLVVAGGFLMELARSSGGELLPVDSEHSAIFQCLHGEERAAVRRIYITASGGALRDRPLDELATVTPEEALAHPNWEMGRRITVDSATLLNKALEIVEAHHLYALDADEIEVVLHRQSVVHSMVEFCDGSVMAQMSPPDMRGPIHFALSHPERVPNADLVGFDLASFSELTFEAPDPNRFPGLALGYDCLSRGGDAGAVLNAADEVAVEAFLRGEIGFQDIVGVIRSVLDAPSAVAQEPASLDALLDADREARRLARARVDELAGVPR